MYKLNTRTLAALLATLLTLPTVACGGAGTGTDTADGSGGGDTSTTAPDETALVAEIPDTKYEDYEFRVLGKPAGTAGDEVFAETETGEAINDAVYTRNRMAEERFGIKISKIESSKPQDDIGTAVLSGEDAYDAALPQLTSLLSLISNGYIIDIDQLTYVDVDKPWWNAGLINSSSVGGKEYFLVGDINFEWRQRTWALCFNKRLYEENGLEEPYTIVRDGKWTMDILEEHCKNLTRDLNGDSVIDKNDQWGLLSSQNAGIGLITSSNVITVKNDGDSLSFNLSNERNIEALGRIRELMTDNSLQLRAEDIGGSNMWNDIINIFREGRALYRISVMADIVGLRDMQDEFGILPLPKYDESDTYTNTLQFWNASGYVIPSSATDLDRTSAILEYMASVSPDTVTEAYYDVTLNAKVARDNDSGEMLDIIYGNMYTDVGLMFEWGDMRSFLKSIINSSSDNVVSNIDANKTAIQTAIDKFVDELK